MRYGALVPALTVAAALGAPLLAEADHNRDRGRRSGYDRGFRGQGESHRSGRRDHKYYRGDARAYDRGYTRGYRPGHHSPSPYSRYPRRYSRYPRHYYAPYPPGVYYRPYPVHRPAPPAYYAPPPLYGYPFAPPPYRRGVHGGISIGVPGFGVSLFF